MIWIHLRFIGAPIVMYWMMVNVETEEGRNLEFSPEGRW